jgi:hypothetical protein
MKVRNIAAAAAAVTLLAAPVAAQAAPQRAAAPAEQGNEMRSSWILGIFAIAAIIAGVLLATSNDNDPVSP